MEKYKSHNKLLYVTLQVLCLGTALLILSCGEDAGKDESSDQSSSVSEKTTAQQSSPKEEAPQIGSIKPSDGLAAGVLTLKYGDEIVETENFNKMGTNLLFADGTISLSLVGPNGAKLHSPEPST